MSIEVLGVSTSTSAPGVAVTPSATANTMGSYATIGTTTTACKSVTFHVMGGDGDVAYMIDIATGATPDIVVNNLIIEVPHSAFEETNQAINLPLAIATSTAIKVRCQANVTSAGNSLGISALCDSVGAYNYAGVTTMQNYGSVQADSGGTTIDAGGTANTKGAYAELSASTSNAMKAIWLFTGANADYVRADDYFLVDIATGAAASEVNILENIPFVGGGNVDALWPLHYGPFIVDVASGVRLSARCQSNSIDAGNRLMDIAVLAADTFAAAGGGGLFVPGPVALGSVGLPAALLGGAYLYKQSTNAQKLSRRTFLGPWLKRQK